MTQDFYIAQTIAKDQEPHVMAAHTLDELIEKCKENTKRHVINDSDCGIKKMRYQLLRVKNNPEDMNAVPLYKIIVTATFSPNINGKCCGCDGCKFFHFQTPKNCSQCECADYTILTTLQFFE